MMGNPMMGAQMMGKQLTGQRFRGQVSAMRTMPVLPAVLHSQAAIMFLLS